jgi:low temperature requirement protein LtrA
VGTALFKTLTAPVVPLSHLVGLGLLALVASAGMAASPLVLSAGTAATLIVVAVWEWASLRRRG